MSKWNIILTFILVEVLIFSPGRSLSQNTIYNNVIDLYQTTPAAPNSAGLGKYFEYPVNMSTGIPSIQIPLFQIQSGTISLPITLSYHAGGVKVNENPSWVGTGWSLNAGGVVNKRVNGLDDFIATSGAGGSYVQPMIDIYSPKKQDGSRMFFDISSSVDSSLSDTYANGTYALPALVNSADSLSRFWGRITQGCIDGESDDFIFSTPEGGGKFFFNQKTQLFQTDKINAWSASYTPGAYVGSVPSVASWHIQTAGGIGYSFAVKEETKNPFANLITSTGFCQPEAISTDLTTAWYLSEINDPKHDKTVTLHYNKVSKKSESGMNFIREYNGSGALFTDNRSLSTRNGDEVFLSHIYFDQGSILFIQDTEERKDRGVKPLKEVKILDKNGNHIKSFVLKYFYTLADTVNHRSVTKHPYNYIYGFPSETIKDTFSRRLFLESIQEVHYTSAGDTIKLPPYKFDYTLDNPLPMRYAYSQDSWGYYNGKITNTTLIPDDVLQMFNTYDKGSGANRYVDTSFARAGTIKSLQYPTGGKTVFEFESNKANSEYIGGLRIRKIINYDSLTGKSLTTEYEYEEGNVRFRPTHYYSYTHLSASNFQTSVSRAESNSIYPLFSGMGSPVNYTRVSRIQSGEGKKLKSTHYFKYEDGTNLNNHIVNQGGVPVPKFVSYNNFDGIEYRTEHFKETTANNFVLIQRDSSEYTALNDFKNFTWNLQTAWTHLYGGWGIWADNDPYVFYPWPMNMLPGSNAYKQLQDQDVVRYKRSFVRDDNGNEVVKESWFDYDTRNGNQWLVKTLNENQDTLITQIKYAAQYDHTTEVSASPVAPVEIISLLKKPGSSDSLLLAAILYSYDGWKLKKVYRIDLTTPVSIGSFQRSYNTAGTFYRDSRYKLFQEVKQWSANAKPLTVATRAGNQAYIWDYEDSQVAASAQNAIQSDIAYTSFETGNTGNWTISGGSVNSSYTITGKKSYNLSGTISKTGLTNQDYIVSYWSRSGSMLVNGASGTAGEQKDGWTFYKHTITSVTSVTVSGTGIIDEIRLHPRMAQMSSYTYRPLVGINSISDAAGRISYYEYDDFKRLSLVRDQYENILKKYCYNYAGELDPCEPVTYYNDEQSGGYTRDNCGAGYTGTYVVYTVPANTYTSTVSKADANQQAINDVAANKATFANTNGSCIPSIYVNISYENYDYAWSINTVYADVVVRFFADEAMTIPISVTDLTVNFIETIIGNNGSSSINQTNPFSRTITGSEYTVEARYPVEVDDSMSIQIYSNIYLDLGAGYQIAF